MDAEHGPAKHIRRMDRTPSGTEWQWQRAALSATAEATTGFPSEATPAPTRVCIEVKESEQGRHQD